MFTIGDGGTGVGLDWDTTTHRYGDPVLIYVCEANKGGGEVSVEAPANVTITPARSRAYTPTVLQLSVTVDRGARGRLKLTFLRPDGAAFGHAQAPEIVPEENGWHFAQRI
jgi:hypothetical protein